MCIRDSDDTDGGDQPTLECIEDADFSLEGSTVAIADQQFMNRFDPDDTTIYDPNDVAALPGPVLVDAWGDSATGAYGIIAVFPPGFSTPLHTHPNLYHGVVMRGEVTNPFGPDLEPFLTEPNSHGETVLDPGSYWHVPAESQHATTCVGPEVCWIYFHGDDAFIFDPIVDANNDLMAGVELEERPADAVELPSSELEFAGDEGSFVEFAFPWFNDNADHGTFGRFIPNGTSPLHTHGGEYYGIVIDGTLSNPFSNAAAEPALGEDGAPVIGQGGFWEVPADAVHVTQCGDAGCLWYLHQNVPFDFQPVCEPEENMSFL